MLLSIWKIQEDMVSPVGQQLQPTLKGEKGLWGACQLQTTQRQGPASPWATRTSSVHTRQRIAMGTCVPGWPWAGIVARGQGQSPASTVACCQAPPVHPGHMKEQCSSPHQAPPAPLDLITHLLPKTPFSSTSSKGKRVHPHLDHAPGKEQVALPKPEGPSLGR